MERFLCRQPAMAAARPPWLVRTLLCGIRHWIHYQKFLSPGPRNDVTDHLQLRIKTTNTSFFHSPLQKREGTGASFLYRLDWKSKHYNWNVDEWKATRPSLRVFCGKLSKWEPCKSCKFHTNPYNFLACLPNPYKLSILGDICRATILPFSSSKYFYSW